MYIKIIRRSSSFVVFSTCFIVAAAVLTIYRQTVKKSTQEWTNGLFAIKKNKQKQKKETIFRVHGVKTLPAAQK